MKLSQFRQLIREQVRHILSELDNSNVQVYYYEAHPEFGQVQMKLAMHTLTKIYDAISAGNNAVAEAFADKVSPHTNLLQFIVLDKQFKQFYENLVSNKHAALTGIEGAGRAAVSTISVADAKQYIKGSRGGKFEA